MGDCCRGEDFGIDVGGDHQSISDVGNGRAVQSNAKAAGAPVDGNEGALSAAGPLMFHLSSLHSVLEIVLPAFEGDALWPLMSPERE